MRKISNGLGEQREENVDVTGLTSWTWSDRFPNSSYFFVTVINLSKLTIWGSMLSYTVNM